MAGTKITTTILRLRDQMSGGLVNIAKTTKGVSTEMVNATQKVVDFKNKAVTSIGTAAKKFTDWGKETAGTLAKLAAKTSLSEAMDIEGYRVQLETATNDTKKAASLLQTAVQLGGKTPFDAGQFTAAAVKFETMGMSAQTWLSRTGDMAATTGKDLDEAAAAIIAAQDGELDSLKEFGIDKAAILQQGEKLFTGIQLVNGEGQVTNQEKLNETLLSLIGDRFAGGMEKQASTLKGLWGVIKNNASTSLAELVGVSEDGSVRAESAFELLKEKAGLLATKLQEWQADGTIDRLSQMFANGLAWAVEKAGQAFDWVRNNGDTIFKVLQGLVAVFAVGKVVQFAMGVMQAVKTFASFAKVIGLFVIQNPIVLAIGAAIAAGVLLWQNWDAVKAWALMLWENIKLTFGGIRDTVLGVFDGIKQSVTAVWENITLTFGGIRDSILGAFSAAKTGVDGFFTWIGESIAWLDQKIVSIPVLGTLYKGFKEGVSGAISGAKNLVSAIGNAIGGNALGTSYWSGGLTRVNERGGEIMNLPNGTQIIPHDVSRRMAGGHSISVNLTVQGNIIGNARYADELGGIIAGRIMRAMANT